ncbi:hypothetical protein Tco_0624355 [Tanacetum coccineum]|uniref:Uncharacterized protein n=1 Tax=Tanacetum coccineum TaxID=301880 RepID=A0ABQ4WDS8_9ASTR
MTRDNGNSNKKRNKVSWKPISVMKTFLEACLHKLAFNRKEGSGLKSLSWKRVSKCLVDGLLGVDWIRNPKYLGFCYLIKSLSTMGCNDHAMMVADDGVSMCWFMAPNMVLNDVMVSDAADIDTFAPSWNKLCMRLDKATGRLLDVVEGCLVVALSCFYMIVASLLQKNKNVESLKTTSLPFLELCAPLFDGTLSSGLKSHGPSSTELRRVVEPHMVEDNEHIEVVNVESPTHPCSSNAPRLPVKTKKGKQLMDRVEEEILGFIHVVANKINQPGPPLTSPPSVEDGENKLNDLGWDENDPF